MRSRRPREASSIVDKQVVLRRSAATHSLTRTSANLWKPEGLLAYIRTFLPNAAARSWPLSLDATQLHVSGDVSSSWAIACEGWLTPPFTAIKDCTDEGQRGADSFGRAKDSGDGIVSAVYGVSRCCSCCRCWFRLRDATFPTQGNSIYTNRISAQDVLQRKAGMSSMTQSTYCCGRVLGQVSPFLTVAFLLSQIARSQSTDRCPGDVYSAAQTALLWTNSMRSRALV